MNHIKNYIFNLLFISWTLIIALLFTIPIIINKNISLFVARFWAKFVLTMLKFICGIEIEIRGLNFLPKNNKFIIASKHQSALETIAYLVILKDPIYILKKELTKIPLYGRFLKKMQAIEIDRSLGPKALKQIIRQTKNLSDLNRPFVIFPEGTRSLIGQKLPYQPGIAAIYDLKIAPIIPAALNCGLYWSKSGFKVSGKAIIEFMPQGSVNLSRKDFLKELQDTIETKSCNLK